MKYLLISLLFLALSFFNLLQPFQNVLIWSLNPLQQSFHQGAVHTLEFSDFLANISSLYEENQDLKSQILELYTSLEKLSSLERENQALKEQFLAVDPTDNLPLPYSPSENDLYVIASITGNSVDSTRSTIYIDKGIKAGLSIGDAVIYKNNLVGKVIEVSPNRSLVALIYSPQVSMGAKNISTTTPSEGIVTGEYGTGLQLTRVLQREPLNIGDVFVTSGREGEFPSGLIIGKVSEIFEIPTDPLKSAVLTPLIEIDRLVHVFVLLGDK